jgi:hypothetical protein
VADERAREARELQRSARDQDRESSSRGLEQRAQTFRRSLEFTGDLQDEVRPFEDPLAAQDPQIDPVCRVEPGLEARAVGGDPPGEVMRGHTSGTAIGAAQRDQRRTRKVALKVRGEAIERGASLTREVRRRGIPRLDPRAARERRVEGLVAEQAPGHRRLQRDHLRLQGRRCPARRRVQRDQLFPAKAAVGAKCAPVLEPRPPVGREQRKREIDRR